ADGQSDPIRVPSENLEVNRSDRELRTIFAGRSIVDGSYFWIVVADRKPAAIRVEGEGIDTAAHLPLVHLLSGLQIKPQDVIPLSDGNVMIIWAEGDGPLSSHRLTQDGVSVSPAPDCPHLGAVRIWGGLGEKATVLAKEQGLCLPLRFNPSDLTPVGNAVHGDDTSGVDFCRQLVRLIDRHNTVVMPAWAGAEVWQGHRDRGLVAESLVEV